MQETSDGTSRIRLLLYSPNQTTKTLLDAALSGRYRLRCESQAQRVHHLAASSEVDVLIIDLDQNKQSAEDAAALLSNLELLDVPDPATGTLALKPEYRERIVLAKDRMVRDGRWKLEYSVRESRFDDRS